MNKMASWNPVHPWVLIQESLAGCLLEDLKRSEGVSEIEHGEVEKTMCSQLCAYILESMHTI